MRLHWRRPVPCPRPLPSWDPLPDRPVEPAPSLRADVAARVSRIAPHLPDPAREALVSARARFLARWPTDTR
jgi:hypothetical protein